MDGTAGMRELLMNMYEVTMIYERQLRQE